MELDDFKAHWNNIQHKEFQHQNFSAEKLEQIIMNTTDTLNQLHTKSLFWKTLGSTTCKMLIGILAVAFLMTIVDAIHLHKLANIPMAFAYMLIILLYCIVTIWAYNRQEQIFTIYNNGDVKATLKQTITAFKKFYWMFNLIYLFLYPVYTYAVIKLFIPYWHPSPKTVYITCAIVTAVCLAGGHWYYKVRFFKKLKSLEGNLRELEG